MFGLAGAYDTLGSQAYGGGNQVTHLHLLLSSTAFVQEACVLMTLSLSEAAVTCQRHYSRKQSTSSPAPVQAQRLCSMSGPQSAEWPPCRPGSPPRGCMPTLQVMVLTWAITATAVLSVIAIPISVSMWYAGAAARTLFNQVSDLQVLPLHWEMHAALHGRWNVCRAAGLHAAAHVHQKSILGCMACREKTLPRRHSCSVA